MKEETTLKRIYEKQEDEEKEFFVIFLLLIYAQKDLIFSFLMNRLDWLFDFENPAVKLGYEHFKEI